MNKLVVFGAAVLVAFGVMADDAADLTKTATEPAVEAEFDQPDGAAIKMKDDGSFQIFARGTGTYDFNDPDDINDAKKEATLKAKAALAKFMNEKLSTEESFSEAAKKTKTMTSDGQNQSVNISKEAVKTSSTTIKNKADALLKGVITLKTQKIARGAGGEVQVTVGVSSKTLQAVSKLQEGINNTPGPDGSSGGGSTQNLNGKQKPIVTTESDSDF